MHRASILLVFVLLTSGCTQPIGSGSVPTLDVSAEWPEQKLPNDLIHKTRVPRGGTFDVIARIDARDVDLYRWEQARAELAVRPKLDPVAVLVDGVEREDPAAPLTFKDIRPVREVRWRFKLAWEVRRAEPEYAFDVTLALPGRYADLRKSVVLEQGVSCCDTTFLERLRDLAKSDCCRLEPIGRSTFGREMHLLRVTDFSVPDDGKKVFLMLGAYHGNEVSGHASILDFVQELVAKPENARYLKSCVLYIIPCMNPDGREIGWHLHPAGDINEYMRPGREMVEGRNVAQALEKYRDRLTGALGMTTHQWGRPYLLLSHDPFEFGDWSDTLIRNVGVRVSNELSEYVHVQSSPPRYDGYGASRGYMFLNLKVPSFVLENAGGVTYNIGRLMPHVVRELHVYYAVLDQLIEPTAVKPVPHPPVAMTFPENRNYKVYKVAKPPVIDGKLDEECWKRPSIIANFTTGGRRPEQKGKTTVRVVYDDRNLYVAYECPDLKPTKIAGRDASVWKEDGADFMFDTNLNRWSYFQFQANANGAFADNYWAIPGIPEGRLFNVKDYEVAGSVKNGAIEIRIPFDAFNGFPFVVDPAVPSPPKPGTVWGVNFFRNDPSTSWAPMSGGAHAPWQFNAMTFTGETK